MAAVQSSAVAPNATEYGGDEISALVLDPGTWTTRVGFAGEDIPKSVVPTSYGFVAEDSRYLFGDNSVHTPRPNLEIRNPMADDGTVEDWDTAVKLWEYAITSRLTSMSPGKASTHGLNDPTNGENGVEAEAEKVAEGEKSLEENPLLMTEPGWNSAKAREAAVTVAFEEWGCPAFWLARNSVCAAFAGGKASALVIDVGASQISVTPIHDGLILKKGIARSPLAGNWLSQQIRLLFNSSQPPVPLTPHYLVSSKNPVDAGVTASATYRTFATLPHDSFRKFEEERVLQEFKESVVQVWHGPGRLGSVNAGTSNEEIARSTPGRPFEMPDGWNQVFTSERYRVAEGMWDSKMALFDAENPAPQVGQTIPELLKTSLAGVDVDIRPHLLGNVIVTGASSLLTGFNERLNMELQNLFSGPRVKIHAAGNTAERKFASWIGGSILGSLGTFHQMWISRAEYQEHGANIVEKRCK